MTTEKIQGGINAPKGFYAAGLRAGIREGKENKDMALIYSEVPAVCAGTFTRNIVKAAPVLWDQEIVKNHGSARAVVINSGIANACTGSLGYENCREEAAYAADLLGLAPEEVLTASTGVIGPQLNMEIVKKGIKMLAESRSRTTEAADDAATAILTTDTHKKEIALTACIGGKKVTIGGMCKGSGMIHPNMGTMLAFVTSDAAIEQSVLQQMVKEVVEDTFNMVSVDGDTSTNDTCLVLCNGLAGNPVLEEDSSDLPVFREAITEILTWLSKQIAGDGEGCTRLFEVTVKGAGTRKEAKIISKSVVCSNLTKAAVFGKDANWGRILCAMGYSGANFDPALVDIDLESSKGSLSIVREGIAADYSEERAADILSANPVRAILHLHQGEESATAWGCDLTYEYVRINADYRS